MSEEPTTGIHTGPPPQLSPEEPPTLGDLADNLRKWQRQGVTSESLQYAASRVWPDINLLTVTRVKRVRDQVLEEAAKIISGDREDQYGSARDGFTRTGKIWAALLDLPEPIEPELVAVMLTGLKLSRLAHDPGHLDSGVDGSGYLALGQDIAAEKADEAASILLPPR